MRTSDMGAGEDGSDDFAAAAAFGRPLRRGFGRRRRGSFAGVLGAVVSSSREYSGCGTPVDIADVGYCPD